MKKITVSAKAIAELFAAPETKPFFSNYSKVAGRIKKIQKMKGAEKDAAMEALNNAISAMQELDKLLG